MGDLCEGFVAMIRRRGSLSSIADWIHGLKVEVDCKGMGGSMDFLEVGNLDFFNDFLAYCGVA